MFGHRQLALVKELTAEDWREIAQLYRGFQAAVGAVVNRARKRAKDAA
jgi:hypothetical protein